MEPLATTRSLRRPDRRVVIAGDWHENTNWAAAALRTAGRQTQTILHVGDFGLFSDGDFLPAVDDAARRAGISTIAVTPGNHEDWGALSAMFAQHPHQAVRVSDTVWVLPPAFAFWVGGRSFVSLGGAASTDFLSRTPGIDWWPEEVVTGNAVDRAIRGGWVDIMLTHDTVHRSGIPVVESLIGGTERVSAVESDYARTARDKVTRAYRAIGPTLLFHGHLHAYATGGQPGNRRIFSLGRDGDRLGNLVTVDMDTLTVVQLAVFDTRSPARLPETAALMWA